MPPVCIIIAGPTAIGKTQLAIEVARHFHTEIISADSRQCYHELNIGVARPDSEQLQQVQHHFIATHSIHENVTAAYFESYALNKMSEIFSTTPVAVVAGGTGLYLRALEYGLDKIPAIAPEIREDIVGQFQQSGIAWLIEQLQLEDPSFAVTGEMQNPQRMMRALEVMRGTGQSILHFHQHGKAIRPFHIIKIGLELPREVLYERINQRVDLMMNQGQEEEARSVYANRSLNALQTVGYAELFDYFDGTITKAEAVNLIKQHTRNYAKRQMTWLKREEGMQWMPPDADRVIKYLAEKISALHLKT